MVRATRTRVPRRVPAAIATCLLAIGVGACGGDNDEPTIDLSKLDVGNFSTTPKEYGTAETDDKGRLLEGTRLGNHIPLPAEIDPSVIYAPPINMTQVRSFFTPESSALQNRFDVDPALLNEELKDLVAGFVSSGASDEVENLSYELDNTVMLYSSEEAAAAAAEGFAGTAFQEIPGLQKVEIDNYPAAHAYVDPRYHGMVESFFATGRFVIFSFVWDMALYSMDTTDVPRLTAHVEKSIRAIESKTKSFSPTPVGDLKTLPVDIDGMLGRTLITIEADPVQRGIPAVYDRHGGLQISINPGGDRKLYEEAGVDLVSFGGGQVFRAKDPNSAVAVTKGHSKYRAIQGYRPVDPPSQLPNANCREHRGEAADSSYYCNITHGRYAAEISADQLADAHQRISAQYALLVNAS